MQTIEKKLTPADRENQHYYSGYLLTGSVYFLTRFLLISLNSAEFTDAYHLIAWSPGIPMR